MKSPWLLAAFVAIGCSGGPKPPPASPKVEPKGPSEEEYVGYSIGASIVTTKDRQGNEHTWAVGGYQPDGEEKLQFSRTERAPAVTVPPTLDTSIEFSKSFEGFEGFKSLFKTFVRDTRMMVDSTRTHGFGPFAVTNDLYFGHTFWDLDVWMVPTMLFLAPDTAKAAAQYRIDRSKQAHLNYLEWARASKKNFPNTGMKFPWESAVSGKEVCVQKTKNQEHISGDVVWGLTQAEAMGLADSATVGKVSKDVSTYYQQRATKTDRGLEILSVTSPNEKFEGNNDLYTNMLAEWLKGERHWKSKTTFYFPRDSKSLLNYDDDPLIDYQQAAGLLAIYPLQNPLAEANAKAMMERFADKLSPNGPAMSHAVVATIWARMGEPEKAYAAWIESWKPYLKGPDYLFSERRNSIRPYFFTGAAGAINTVLYGFIGFRMDRIPLPGAKWTQRLKSGWWLSAKPCVPEVIGQIKINGITIDGKLYDVTADSKGNFSVRSTTLWKG